MDRSESIKELVTALSKAQGEIGAALKDTKNEFFKSKYADLASVVDAIKEPLSGNGLSYTQVLHDANNAVCVETLIFHNSGEWISTGTLTIPVMKHDAQGFGSALTYARRYSLSAAFGVAPEEDDGNAAAKAKPKTEEKPINKHAPVNAAMVGVEIPEKIMEELRFLASELVDLVEVKNSPSKARDLLDTTRLTEDEYPVEGDYLLALSQILAPNSKTRSALKKEGERRREEAKNPPTLAEAM